MRRRALSVISTAGRGGCAYCLAWAVAGGLAVSAFAQAPAAYGWPALIGPISLSSHAGSEETIEPQLYPRGHETAWKVSLDCSGPLCQGSEGRLPTDSAALQAAALLRAHRSCVVPPLRGDTLATARRALSAAHCRLGSVHGPARHHGTLRVTRQSARAGKRLANDARVSLWVGFTQQERPGSTGQTIYVANSGNNSITEYAATASGNVSPTRTISGSNTGLRAPDGLAVGSSGTIYVASSGSNSITEYAVTASGNVSPTRTISGSNTGLRAPDGLAVGSSGTIYVANFGGASITEYASGVSGNVAPVRTISGANTTLSSPWGVGVNTSGALYVTNRGGSGIVEFVTGASGNVAPVRTISGAHTLLYEAWGIVLDASGTAYVSNGSSINNAITEYSSGASGNVSPNNSISGSNTGVSAPNGEAFDSSGTLYICNNDSTNSVTAYASGATGNASPLRIISGVSTGLNGCSGLAVH